MLTKDKNRHFAHAQQGSHCAGLKGCWYMLWCLWLLLIKELYALIPRGLSGDSITESTTKCIRRWFKWRHLQATKDLMRRAITQAFSRPVVEPVHRIIDLILAHPEQVGLLGKDLAVQTIVALIEPTPQEQYGCAKYTSVFKHWAMNSCSANSLPLSKVKVLHWALGGRRRATRSSSPKRLTEPSTKPAQGAAQSLVRPAQGRRRFVGERPGQQPCDEQDGDHDSSAPRNLG